MHFITTKYRGFPGGLVKNLACNALDPSSIPGSRSYPGDGDAGSIAGSERSLEKEMATHSLPGKSHGQRSLEGYSPWSCKRVGHDLATKQQQAMYYIIH